MPRRGGGWPRETVLPHSGKPTPPRFARLPLPEEGARMIFKETLIKSLSFTVRDSRSPPHVPRTSPLSSSVFHTAGALSAPTGHLPLEGKAVKLSGRMSWLPIGGAPRRGEGAALRYIPHCSITASMPLLPSALPPKGEASRYGANNFLNLIALPRGEGCRYEHTIIYHCSALRYLHPQLSHTGSFFPTKKRPRAQLKEALIPSLPDGIRVSLKLYT